LYTPCMLRGAFLRFSNIFYLLPIKKKPNALSSSMISKTRSSSKRIFFFLSTLPNTSSFYLLKSAFKALSLQAKMKL
jgi:hypothetical protein